MRILLFLLGLTAVLVFGGCGGSPPPTVDIDLARFGAPFASMTQLEGASPLAGAMAQGGPGDWLLENERFQVVISAGRIVDMAPLGADPLREVATVLRLDGPRVVYSQVAPGFSDSLAAELVATGADPEHPGLEVRTTYRVVGGSSALDIETVVVNAGYTPVPGLEVGDRIAWGRARAFVPGYTDSLPSGVLPGDRILGDGEGSAYMLRGEGASRVLHQPGASVLTAAPLNLVPRDTLVYRRVLTTASGGASAVTHLAGNPDWVPVEVMVTGEDEIPVAGCTVVALDAEGRPLSRGLTLEDGAWLSRLPEGRIHLVLTHPERGSKRTRVSVDPGKREPPFSSDFALLFREKLDDPARVHLRARTSGASVPALWIFEGLKETPDPEFGPGYHLVGGNAVYSWAGDRYLSLPPGTYRVTCVRGVFHEIWQTRIKVGSGDTEVLDANVPGLSFDPGWVAADLGASTYLDSLGTVAPEHRMLAAACTNVGWVAPWETAFPEAASDGVGALPPLKAWSETAEFAVVLNGSRPEDFGGAWETWMEQLKDGREVVGIGVSGGADLVDGGRARTLIRVSDPSSREQAMDGLRSGTVMVTNGPLIDFTLEGASPGEIVESDGYGFNGRLRVVAPAGVDVSLIEILVNGQMHSEYRIQNEDRLVRFDEAVSIRAVHGGRSFVQVRVTGREPLPASFVDGELPVAFTNPIWIEIPYSRIEDARDRAPSGFSGTVGFVCAQPAQLCCAQPCAGGVFWHSWICVRTTLCAQALNVPTIRARRTGFAHCVRG